MVDGVKDQKTDAESAVEGSRSYRVLARKYRPASFDELVGQDPMVRTLRNAFATGRIAQGYMLTGVRGVGKTTTARIIARALNHQLPGGADVPSVSPEMGIHCADILASRHMDVEEMDAASHTGIADIRQLIEHACYRPVSARYKVYIIDEVHMLSNHAFNGLLKTLEEPPDHVKFIFATTEIRKVPVTILSRCQRFDLRRVGIGELMELLRSVLVREELEAEEEALRLIARASEGSVRDALSMLDQAISYSVVGQPIQTLHVREMLGLADRSCVIDLFRAAMEGDVQKTLMQFRSQYDKGGEPVLMLSDLAGFVHIVTRAKYVTGAGSEASLSQTERDAVASFCEKMDVRILARAWQVLLKGIAEVRESSWPLASAEMLLVRLTHMADLPTPDVLARMITEIAPTGTPVPNAAACAETNRQEPQVEQAPAREFPKAVRPVQEDPCPDSQGGQTLGGQTLQKSENPSLPSKFTSFQEIVDLAGQNRDLLVKSVLRKSVRLLHFETGAISFSLEEGAPEHFVQELRDRLLEWTGISWKLNQVEQVQAPTLEEEEAMGQDRLFQLACADPVVQDVLSRFPGAEIEKVLPISEVVNSGE